jgi:hypothetical protein
MKAVRRLEVHKVGITNIAFDDIRTGKRNFVLMTNKQPPTVGLLIQFVSYDEGGIEKTYDAQGPVARSMLAIVRHVVTSEESRGMLCENTHAVTVEPVHVYLENWKEEGEKTE